MKKKYRLKKNWEFDSILKSKSVLVNKHIIVYYKKANSFRAGLTVPKKFADSVGRNFYKRQLRAILHELNLYHLKFNFVFIVRKDFIKAEFCEKENSIKKLMEKLSNDNK